jgi:hypothetical protein
MIQVFHVEGNMTRCQCLHVVVGEYAIYIDIVLQEICF